MTDAPKDYGWINAEDARVINNALRELASRGYVRVLEIGVHAGLTARGMKHFLEANGAEIDYHGIDPGLLCDLEEPFAGAKMLKARSEESFYLFPDGYFDLIFLDGNHSRNAVILDTFNYAPKVRAGGFLIFHDTSPTMQGQDYQYEGPKVPEFHVAVLAALDMIGFPWAPWVLVEESVPTDTTRCGARCYRNGLSNKRVYVQLGKIGDLLNVLPLAYRDHSATGERSIIMVSEAYAPLLDGIGYADCVAVPNAFEDIAGAWPRAELCAKKHGARIICTQIYGENLSTAETCSSFMRESWAQVPDAPAWGTLPLIFDRRDKTREAWVTKNLLQNANGKPYVVVSLTGTSSPFGGNRELMLYLRRTLGKELHFVDVSAFIAHRFYDLLGVMEGAHCIVSVDSGLLHLAHACPQVPVVAFITRQPSAWHGSPWRPQHVARFYYDEMPERFGDVAEAVKLSR